MYTSETRQCQNCKQGFVIEPEDFDFYAKIKVPPPTWCPECRFQRRLVWRNERALYHRKCDATGKDIFSMFPVDAKVRVYGKEYWWSDAWDASAYARDYDFSRPFFEQFRDLMSEVPLFSRSVNEPMTNSDYCNNCGWMKNCYLVFNASHNEDCSYSVGIEETKDSLDCFDVRSGELCYDSSFCTTCYNARHSVDCADCRDVYFCKNCVNCSDCFGCVNLRGKQYCIFNEQYSKEEYFKKLKELGLDSHKSIKAWKEKFSELVLKYPNKYVHERHNTNVTGEYVFNSKNVQSGYLVDSCEDCRYIQYVKTKPGAKDSYDYTIFGGNAELMYECMQVGYDASRVKFSLYSFPNAQRAEYVLACPSSQDIFGCVGLKKKQYCILNKQYTKDEYEALVPKIIEHMNAMPYSDKRGNVYRYGEFFPAELSPLAYNQSLAQDFFPLSQEEIEKSGYRWQDPQDKNYATTIAAGNLPDTIKETTEDVQQATIECAHQGKCEDNCSFAFRIVPQELEFYRKMNIPLPRECFACRHAGRIKYRNSFKLYKRSCQCTGAGSENNMYKNATEHFHKRDHCPNEFETSYAPDRPEIVYCEQCYQAEVA